MTGDTIIGRNIRRERLKYGLSQQAVAAYLGITFQQVQKYETGANRISALKLHKLALLFQCRMEELCAGVSDNAMPPPHASSYGVNRLLLDFSRIQSQSVRDRICSIVRLIADSIHP